MRVALMAVALGSALQASGALAQDRTPRLALYLNGASTDGSVDFTFGRDGCRASAGMTQRYGPGVSRSTRHSFDFGALDTDDYGIATAEALDIAQINMNLVEGAPDLAIDILLVSPDPDQRAQWIAQGAECEGDACAITISQRGVPLVVGGPSAGNRAEFVLQDLRTLAAACATTEQG